MEDNLKKIFEHERDLPYRIPLTSEEPDNTCIGKHLRLAKILKSEGLAVRFRICHFRWSDLPLPPDVLGSLKVDNSTHLYLEIHQVGEWHPVDATWDSGLVDIFHINEWEKPTALAVPCLSQFSPEESERCAYQLSLPSTEIDNTANRVFFERLNTWLARIRTLATCPNPDPSLRQTPFGMTN